MNKKLYFARLETDTDSITCSMIVDILSEETNMEIIDVTNDFGFIDTSNPAFVKEELFKTRETVGQLDIDEKTLDNLPRPIILYGSYLKGEPYSDGGVPYLDTFKLIYNNSSDEIYIYGNTKAICILSTNGGSRGTLLDGHEDNGDESIENYLEEYTKMKSKFKGCLHLERPADVDVPVFVLETINDPYVASKVSERKIILTGLYIVLTKVFDDWYNNYLKIELDNTINICFVDNHRISGAAFTRHGYSDLAYSAATMVEEKYNIKSYVISKSYYSKYKDIISQQAAIVHFTNKRFRELKGKDIKVEKVDAINDVVLAKKGNTFYIYSEQKFSFKNTEFYLDKIAEAQKYFNCRILKNKVLGENLAKYSLLVNNLGNILSKDNQEWQKHINGLTPRENKSLDRIILND